MSYRPSHAKPGSLARFAARSGVIAGAAALAAATAGSLAPVAANAATTYTENGSYQFASNEANGNWQMSDSPISNAAGSESLGADGVTLTASGANNEDYGTAEIVFPLGKLSSLFDSSGNFQAPKITTTDGSATPYVNYYVDANDDGEPLSFSYNGATYEGPGGDNLFTRDSSGDADLNGWAQGNSLITQGMTMSQVQSAYANRADGGTTDPEVWAAIGVQSTDSSIVTATVTSVNGTDLVKPVTAPTVTLPAENTQSATEDKAYDLNDPATVTPSGTAVTYRASGLPNGLTIDSSTGEISGTPAETGQYAVTVSASAAGATTAYQHFVLDVAAVTYTASTNGGEGVIRNAYSGKYLNVMANTYATGSKIGQWDSTGASHEKFEIVTLAGSDGTKAGYLEAIAPNGSKWFVVANGTGQLTLGGQAPAALTDAAGEGTGIAGSSEDMLKSGSYYTFPNDGGKVADDSGWSLKNGASVISYAKNSGKNQQWSLP